MGSLLASASSTSFSSWASMMFWTTEPFWALMVRLESEAAMVPSGLMSRMLVLGLLGSSVSVTIPSLRTMRFCVPPGTSRVGNVGGCCLLFARASSLSLMNFLAVSALSSRTASIRLISLLGRLAAKEV